MRNFPYSVENKARLFEMTARLYQDVRQGLVSVTSMFFLFKGRGSFREGLCIILYMDTKRELKTERRGNQS